MAEMQRFLLALLSCSLSCALAACGACPKKTAEAPPTAAASAPAAAAEPASPSAPDLTGFWAEFWAPPKGRAETQRFVFLGDGRFGWLAPRRDAAPVDPLQRSGRFSFEGQSLVLEVERERFADGRVTEHAERVRMVLELGECPDNQEARALDASYVCRSIGGRAFWRRSPTAGEAAEDATPYLQ